MFDSYPPPFPITMAPECQGDWKEGGVVGGVGGTSSSWWVWIVSCIIIIVVRSGRIEVGFFVSHESHVPSAVNCNCN